MRVMVTGASRGIGRAICEVLLKEGHHVFGVARFASQKPIDHPNFSSERVDFQELQLSSIKRLQKSCSDLDALVLCAGRGRFGSLEEISYEEIDRLMRLNFISQSYMAKAFLPHFKKMGRGQVIFIGSEAALVGKRKGAVYCASKFALRGFAQALRDECASSGVRVTLVNPGMVKSSFFDELSFEPGNDPVQHLLPEDVAEVVLGVLNARPGAHIDEVNLSPQTHKIDWKH